MDDSENYEIRLGSRETLVPKIGGVLNTQQRGDVEMMKHVPPADGYILPLKGVGGAVGQAHLQALVQFRGAILSEMVSIEYLLAAVPLADSLAIEDEADFSYHFWKGMNADNRMMGRKIGDFITWVAGNFLTTTPANFETSTSLLLSIRNGLSHYPVQAAFDGKKNTLTPFVYRAKTEEMFIFDDRFILVTDVNLAIAKTELQTHFDRLFAARRA